MFKERKAEKPSNVAMMNNEWRGTEGILKETVDVN